MLRGLSTGDNPLCAFLRLLPDLFIVVYDLGVHLAVILIDHDHNTFGQTKSSHVTVNLPFVGFAPQFIGP